MLADREIQAEKDSNGSPIIENIFHINLVRASPSTEALRYEKIFDVKN